MIKNRKKASKPKDHTNQRTNQDVQETEEPRDV